MGKILHMSSSHKNLDQFGTEGLKPVSGKRIAIITAEWNQEVTFSMRDAAIEFLGRYGLNAQDMVLKNVPGSFELIYGAVQCFEQEDLDGIILIGCVIQGETPHFTFISQAVAQGAITLSVTYKKPVVFGVLTPLNMEQALDRAGGKHGNKGIEAASTLVKMLNF